MAKILFIGAKDISAVRQPNHQDCPLGCDFRLEIKMLRSRLLHRIFSFISDVLSTKSPVFLPSFCLPFQKTCKKRILNCLCTQKFQCMSMSFMISVLPLQMVLIQKAYEQNLCKKQDLFSCNARTFVFVGVSNTEHVGNHPSASLHNLSSSTHEN